MTRFHYIFAVVLLVLLCLVHVHNVSAVQIIKTKTNNKDNLLEVSARVHTHANATAKGITDLFCSGCKAVDTLAQDPASAVRAHCQEREWHEAADILRKRTQVASTVNAGGEEVDVWHACTNQGPQIEESFQPGRGREIILFYFVEMMSGFLFNNLTPPPADQVCEVVADRHTQSVLVILLTCILCGCIAVDVCPLFVFH